MVSRFPAVRAWRGPSLAVLAATCLVLGGSDVFAAHQVGQTGVIGNYAFTDTAGTPAGYCNYNGGGTAGHVYLVAIRVNPPTAYWPAGQASNHGTIGFRLKLQHLSGGVWHNVNTGAEAQAPATVHSSALFGPRHVAWAGPNTGRDRALAVLSWYRPDTTVLGRARVVIDHYRSGFDGITRSYCRVVYVTAP
jgi:hypothetical protein